MANITVNDIQNQTGLGYNQAMSVWQALKDNNYDYLSQNAPYYLNYLPGGGPLPTQQQLISQYGVDTANKISSYISSGDIGSLKQISPELANNVMLNQVKYGTPNPTGSEQPFSNTTIQPGSNTGGSIGGIFNPSTPSQPSTPSGSSATQKFINGLQGLPYFNTPAFQDIVNQFTSDAGRTLPNDNALNNWISNFKSYGSTFANQFKNIIGRDPTADEYNTFFSEVVAPMQPWFKTPDQLQVSQLAADTINRDFSSLAQQAAEEKSKALAQQLTSSGSAFDVWQKGYNDALSTTESQLADYQTKLFEKLRPQLLTSLNAQGLLNSGALNEAFTGAAKDLGESAQNYLAGIKTQAAQDIANQKYAIQSSPGSFALNSAFNVPGNLTASGQQALQNAFGYNQSLALQNLQNSFYKQMYDAQNKGSSPLSQYAGLIAGGVAGGLGKGLGGAFANKLAYGSGPTYYPASPFQG